ncbi:isopeptide-forming domain-containing fimbrial protein [Salinibacterium sp. SWN139]|uniref:SdrD B-like domain-containing protein n=1 Tax=Salinibacterium sp. SWN139 TaxID=2792055 RepID=UPI0018CF3600|nr:SdrD B-like domain-containing protein [Salinibacterium sp. SWN139]MBH0052924.1 isopeptide-forming domain-containing fimbrial protein [Salinibacterium sp. SWN139]
MKFLLRPLLVLALIVTGITVPAAVATAAGTPDVQLDRTVSASTLYGDDVSVTLSAQQTSGSNAYNLTFTDVLPAGATLVDSTYPVSETIALAGGATKLIWNNVADLSSGVVVPLTYSFSYNTSTYDVDDSFTSTAEAFVNSNPRVLVKFNALTGDVLTSSRTGWATDESTTTLVPFLLDKIEPSTESELHRGVHDNKTVYTLEITNNGVNPTTNFSIIDYLPAGLEFLGCSTQDNSADGTEEYPGAGRIDDTAFPAAVDCDSFVPSTSTVTVDPDGSGPLLNDVYTKVEWNSLGTLAAGETATIVYAAAIPLRENVAFTGEATANLDNNTGDLTEDEQQLTNYAVAAGTYAGTVYTDADAATISAEDVAIRKSVDDSDISQGATSIWTLSFDSSEYALATSIITVTDTIPDGLDYVTSSLTPESVVTNADGTITVSWDAAAFVAASSLEEITVETLTRSNYRVRNGAGPVSSNDSWTNTVELGADAEIITDNDGTTSTLAVVDASSAGQTAQGITIDKKVAEPAEMLTPCDASSALTFSDGVTGPFHPGDRVCYELTVTFPGSLDTLDNTVNDFLPAGFTFESFAYGSDHHDIDAADITFVNPPVSATDPTPSSLLTWTIGDVNAAAVFQVLVTAKITDPAAIADGDITANIMKMTYQNTAGDVFQLRDQADTRIEKPIVTLSKGITHLNTVAVANGPLDTLAVQATDRVTYAVVITNSGSQDSENVSIRDNLPSLLECSEIENISDSGVCGASTSLPRSIEWTIPSLDAGDSYTVTYDVITPADSSAGDIFVNTAGVRNYEAETNSGGQQVYVPVNNIDPTLEASANSVEAKDTASVNLRRPTLLKSFTTSINESGNNLGTQATIGETVTYTVKTTIPEGSSVYVNPTVTDTLSSRYAIVGTPTFTVNGGASQNATVAGQKVTALIGADYVNAPNSGDDDVILTITARVLDIAGPKRGDGITNRASLTWQRVNGTNDSQLSNTTTTRIVEPDINLTKKSNAVSGQVEAGQIVTYTLELRNSNASNVSTAYDTTVVDHVPNTVQPVNASNVPVTTDQTLPGGGIWDESERTITFTVASILRGQGPDLTYSVRIVDPLLSGATIVNTVDAITSSIAGGNPNERTALSPLGTEAGGYQANDDLTLRAPELGVSKSATPSSRTIGEVITYTVDVTIPKDVVAYDATIIDTMPTNVRFGEFVSSTCDQAGSPCAESAALIGSPTTTDRTIGYFIGDIATAEDEVRTVTITYTGIVTAAAASGNTLTNTVRPYWNNADTITGSPTTVPAPGDFDKVGTPSTANVSVIEPRLTIDKDVAGQVGDSDTRRAKPGEDLEYTIVVRNAGNSPAYDVTVTDTPDSRVTDFTSAGVVGVTPTDVDPSDGTLGWTIAGPIAAGASVTIKYTVTMPVVDETSELVSAREVINTADVPHYFGVAPSAQVSGIDYKDYDNVTPDVVSVELDLASIGDYVWFDVNNDGVQDSTEPVLAGVGVTVVYAGIDGIFGNTDDETFTRTTDSNGEYLVTQLPGGSYRVTVDASTLPAGMTPSYDLDGTTATPNGVWQGTLAENDKKRDVDFGYTGSGSIGDFIWFDQNKDGVQDANEPGLPGATVTVVFGGLDGDLATTADNITYTASTDEDGKYLVENLPAGPYTVTVSDLPAGYSVLSDPNGGTSATSTTSLTAGQNRVDQDFGYAGTASIGDFVWIDRNGDGVQDSTEPGIFGATVELTWFGEDGVLGGGDDGVFTTTTDGDGLYSFPNLLPGNFSVAVTGGLPAGATNSFDLDGDNDSETPVSLTIGQAVTTVDFGYDVTSVIGDRVWWDRNKDGVQDSNEPGLGGVKILVTYLGTDGVLGGSGAAGDIEFEATTDSNGDWTVTEIPDGNFIVEVVSGVPAGFSPTFDNDSGTASPDEESAVTLVGSDLNQDFGYAGDSSISDTVWLDLNKDGVKDAGEPGLPDAEVTLVWFGPDGAAGGGDDVTFVEITDSNGEYLFDGLPEGNYTATVDTTTLPAGVTPTFDADAGPNQPTATTVASGVGPNSTTAVSLPAATDLDNIDFGYVGTGKIGDTVWLDQNGDGILDDTESGIAEVDVTLTWAGLDGILGNEDDVESTTKTDASGNYLFEDLPSGLFTVELSNLPAGLTSTVDPDGGADDVSELTLTGGEENLDQDFGYRGDAGVGDLLWLDVNNDGIQGTNEPGLPGIVMTVTSPGFDGIFGNEDDIIVTTTTDENGNYLVEGLPAGEVKVSYDATTLTEGYVPSSDLDGDVLFETTATLVSGETRLDVDFIVVGSATLNGVVFDDPNGNGVRDSGDRGIPNAELDVIWDGPNGPVTVRVTTDENGAWELTNLPAGTYTATVDLSSVDAEYRPSTGTTSTVELPAFGERSVIQGLTTLMLAFTGSSIAAGGLLAGLLLLSGLLFLLPTRRVRGGGKQLLAIEK